MEGKELGKLVWWLELGISFWFLGVVIWDLSLGFVSLGSFSWVCFFGICFFGILFWSLFGGCLFCLLLLF